MGTASLALPGLPEFARPEVAQFGWALVIGVLAARLGTGIRRLPDSHAHVANAVYASTKRQRDALLIAHPSAMPGSSTTGPNPVYDL